MIKYKFYASILDKFESYINSSRIYQQYYGFSEEPKVTEEEFENEQFQSLINSINRVPMAWEDSEKADMGTAFNEVIDCLIENRKSDKMKIERVYEFVEYGNHSNNGVGVRVGRERTDKVIALKATYNNRTFRFPINLCKEFANYFKGAITQQYCEGVLSTKYGNVMLYGYIDELMPFFMADIKTTSRYNAFKFKDNWQHIVYPYCLKCMDIHIDTFEYRVTDFKSVWSEVYNFNPITDVPKLINHCEAFIEFLEQNKDLITDTKIFAKE